MTTRLVDEIEAIRELRDSLDAMLECGTGGAPSRLERARKAYEAVPLGRVLRRHEPEPEDIPSSPALTVVDASQPVPAVGFATDLAAHMVPYPSGVTVTSRFHHTAGPEHVKKKTEGDEEIVEWLNALENLLQKDIASGQFPDLASRRGIYVGIADDVKRKWPRLFT